ncbi:type II secretion system protein J [Candidatus Dependentiae bacterium]
MRPGFVLLEIIIAIALASLIGAGVFSSFFQVNKAYKSADNIIDIDAKAGLVQHQLDRDISGAFVPFVLKSMKETTTTTVVTVTTGDQKEASETKEKEEELKRQPMEKAFHARLQDDKFSFLSFVSNNPLTVYDKIRPRIARIVYQLVPEKERRGDFSTYNLIRSELSELPFVEPKEDGTPEEGIRPHELATGITDMSIDFIVRPVKEKKKEAEGEQEEVEDQEKEVPYQKFKEWGDEQIKKVNRNIPHFVKITISFWDRLQKTSKTFVFKTAIIADDAPPLERKKPKKEPEKQKGKEPQKKPEVKQPPAIRRGPGPPTGRGRTRRPASPQTAALRRAMNRRRKA